MSEIRWNTYLILTNEISDTSKLLIFLLSLFQLGVQTDISYLITLKVIDFLSSCCQSIYFPSWKLSSSVQIWQPPGLQCGVYEGQTTFSNDCFLLLFFVQLWYQYDTDGSRYIEADELKVDNLIIDIFMF